MIKSAQLKCFRKHVDIQVEFSNGLNTLRGPNEQGKTTIIEAIVYAFYGSKALRDTLAETVTWGHKESELGVKVVSCFSGVDYTFTRGKSGAECNYVVDGVAKKVVGQAEVTLFATTLLGGDAKVANALMLASQSGLRGALDEGPTAVSGLMAKLADFDLIDSIIVAAQNQLSLGAEAPVREKLAKATAECSEIEVPSEAQADYYESMRASVQAQLELQQGSEPALAAAVDTAAGALSAARQGNAARAVAVEKVNEIDARIHRSHDAMYAEQRVADTRPTPGMVVQATKAVADARGFDALVKAKRVVDTLPAHPEVFWDEPKVQFELALAELQANQAKAAQQGQSERAAAANALKRLITSNKCPTCGAASMTDEHVQTHNAAVRAEADGHSQRANEAATWLASLNADVAAMVAVQKAAAPFEAAVRTLVNRDLPVTVDETIYPPKVTWTGDALTEVPDLKAAEAALSVLNAAHKAADRADGAVAAHKASIDADMVLLLQAVARRDSLTEVDVTPLEEAHDMALASHRSFLGEMGTLINDVASYTTERDAARAEVANAVNRKAVAEARIAELSRELKDLVFNNGLVTKLKTLKPLITDDLWNKVLAAVSTFFSSLRGESSVVTKGPTGFRVNDRSVESLSGSTLDVLAIAIRVAMTKTFIPHATFIVLDEPFAACDYDRTGGGLGFLQAVGFDQVIMASHDPMSESVATNTVALGD